MMCFHQIIVRWHLFRQYRVALVKNWLSRV